MAVYYAYSNFPCQHIAPRFDMIEQNPIQAEIEPTHSQCDDQYNFTAWSRLVSNLSNKRTDHIFLDADDIIKYLRILNK